MGKVDKLDILLNQSLGNRMTPIEFGYWCEITIEFLKRYDVELGMGGAYNGHLAILLREAYEKGREDALGSFSESHSRANKGLNGRKPLSPIKSQGAQDALMQKMLKKG